MIPGFGKIVEAAAERGARRRSAQARRGDHPLDDAGRAARADDHRRQPATAHRARLGHDARRRSTSSLKQFQQMRQMMKQMTTGRGPFGRMRGGGMPRPAGGAERPGRRRGRCARSRCRSARRKDKKKKKKTALAQPRRAAVRAGMRQARAWPVPASAPAAGAAADRSRGRTAPA